MTDAYIASDVMTNLVLTAYDKYVEFALRAQPMFRTIADKRPVNVTNPGETVTFQSYVDLPAVTTPLDEVTDPDFVALSNTTTTSVTLYEYGLAALITRKLQLTSLSDIDTAAADIVAFNMVDSLDGLAQTALAAGTNVLRELSGTATLNSGAITSVTASDTFKAKHVRQAVTRLRTQKVMPRKDNLFWCGAHPEVTHDLRVETGQGGWRQPHEYQTNGNIWSAELGTFEGAFFIENPRCTNSQRGSGSGGTQVRVYNTYFAGKQALAEAVNEEPHMVIGNVEDRLRRKRPMGWYGFLGWSVYRQPSLLRLETASTQRANV